MGEVSTWPEPGTDAADRSDPAERPGAFTDLPRSEQLQQDGIRHDQQGTGSQGQWLALQQELRMKDFVVRQLERQLGFERGVEELLVAQCDSRDRFCEEQVDFLAEKLQGEFDSTGMSAVDAMDHTDKQIEDTFIQRNVCWWQSEAQSVRSMYENVESQSNADQAQLSDQDKTMYFVHLQRLVDTTVRAFNLRRMEAETSGKRRLKTLKDNHAERLHRHIWAVMSCERREMPQAPMLQRDAIERSCLHGGWPDSQSADFWAADSGLQDVEDPEATFDQFNPLASESEAESGSESLASRDTSVPPPGSSDGDGSCDEERAA